MEEEFNNPMSEDDVNRESNGSDIGDELLLEEDDRAIKEPRFVEPIPEDQELNEDPTLNEEVDDRYLTEEFLSELDSDEEEDGVRRASVRWPQFNEQATFKEVSLEVGMLFPNLRVLKKAVTDYSINLGVEMDYIKNDTERVRAKCKESSCEWLIYCSWDKKLNAFQVKRLYGEHTCARNTNTRQASVKWLGANLVQFFRMNVKPEFRDLDAYIRETFSLKLHRSKVYRAWAHATRLMEGSEINQYKRLRDYACEIMRSNPGSTCLFELLREGPNTPGTFRRLYMCIQACKVGFLAGCRPLIGLDGCFLKGIHGGQLLCAVAQDENNAIYPIAFCVVDVENFANWCWFLQMLKNDIGEGTGNLVGAL